MHNAETDAEDMKKGSDLDLDLPEITSDGCLVGTLDNLPYSKYGERGQLNGRLKIGGLMVCGEGPCGGVLRRLDEIRE